MQKDQKKKRSSKEMGEVRPTNFNSKKWACPNGEIILGESIPVVRSQDFSRCKGLALRGLRGDDTKVDMVFNSKELELMVT